MTEERMKINEFNDRISIVDYYFHQIFEAFDNKMLMDILPLYSKRYDAFANEVHGADFNLNLEPAIAAGEKMVKEFFEAGVEIFEAVAKEQKIDVHEIIAETHKKRSYVLKVEIIENAIKKYELV